MRLVCTQEVHDSDDAGVAKGLADERVLAHRLVCHGEDAPSPHRLRRIVSLNERQVNLESYPIQDEPEGEVRFQYKMSLERMAC